MDNGWIKIHRKILKWEWYQDANTKSLFFHLLLCANHADKKWQGVMIKRGQMVTGRIRLSQELGLSEQSIRTSLKRLKSTSEVTIKSTSKYSIITIVNYEAYNSENSMPNQQSNQQSNQQVTSNQPASNQQVTTNKNVRIKELKNEKKTDIPDFIPLKEWNLFLEMRKKNKKVPTEYAKELLIADLENLMAKGHLPKDVLNQSIKNNWQGLFELKNTTKQSSVECNTDFKFSERIQANLDKEKKK